MSVVWFGETQIFEGHNRIWMDTETINLCTSNLITGSPTLSPLSNSLSVSPTSSSSRQLVSSPVSHLSSPVCQALVSSSSPFPALASPVAEADGTASGPSGGGGRRLLASHGFCLAPGLDLSLPCAAALFVAGSRGNRSRWAGLQCRLLASSLDVRFSLAISFSFAVIFLRATRFGELPCSFCFNFVAASLHFYFVAESNLLLKVECVAEVCY
ncbi:uncharacterized protein DS421_4g119180 [Arachis hypogaea]|nr:uncharacterized protein DS421_4g119180 [Arachis hypogaea]